MSGRSWIAEVLAPLLTCSVLLSSSPGRASESKVEKLKGHELTTLLELKLGLKDAVSQAEKLVPGGTVLEVSFQLRRSVPAYGLRIYLSGEIWEGRIDANTGEKVDTWKIEPEHELDDEDRAELEAVQASKITLLQAINSVEQHTGGRALTAGVEETKRGVVWEVVVLIGAKPRKATVDLSTGKVRER